MMGKLAKYSFLLFILGLVCQIIIGPQLNMKVAFFTFICFFVSMMAFLGWFFGGPITVVVKDDRDRR
ncbi:hypothetical protein [Neisseria wadsworthii]|uniref:hypothetical protein n=1 Tax=Neisseria wadsworthii TaxID=607711 RepID=UPI000D2F8393|nr:hypothetical protein [Neisseria wadsworthii]